MTIVTMTGIQNPDSWGERRQWEVDAVERSPCNLSSPEILIYKSPPSADNEVITTLGLLLSFTSDKFPAISFGLGGLSL